MNILITTSSFSVNTFPETLHIIHNPYKRRLTEEEVIGLIEEYQPVGMIAGVEPLTRKVMKKAHTLKAISRCGIGLDSVDQQAAMELGIQVLNTPEAPVKSVAEFTLGLILSLIRRIHILDFGLRKGNWKGPKGNLLYGKTVGIIGCGRIGSLVAQLVTAFGCRVIGFDPYVPKHELCEMVTMDELLKLADIVTLHCPYSFENHHLIGKKQLIAMKSTALLINAARGGLVDEDALYNALVSGEITGAALDCFENEPYIGPLTKLENTLLTPHMASSATEARLAMEKQAVENLLKSLHTMGVLNI
jgi:D-3-phosphoglycerate dehydrogenase